MNAICTNTIGTEFKIDGKRYTITGNAAYVHSVIIMGRWNATKRKMRRELKATGKSYAMVATAALAYGLSTLTAR